MSSTDPDLKRTEGNRPVAIDVVAGHLIVERHSGREESFPLGSGSAILPAPGYVVATIEDQVLDGATNVISGMVYSDISSSIGHSSVPWDYSGETVSWVLGDGLPSEEIPLVDGICVGTDGGLKIKEAGLYFFQTQLFITQGGGNTGDDQVGEFLGIQYFGHNAPFANMQYQTEQTVKETNLDYAYITGTVPIWDVLLQPEVDVSVSAKHTSTGTLTVNGQVMLIRVS